MEEKVEVGVCPRGQQSPLQPSILYLIQPFHQPWVLSHNRTFPGETMGLPSASPGAEVVLTAAEIKSSVEMQASTIG